MELRHSEGTIFFGSSLSSETATFWIPHDTERSDGRQDDKYRYGVYREHTPSLSSKLSTYQHDCPVTISTDTSAVRCSVNRAMDIRVSQYLSYGLLFGDNHQLQRSIRDTFSNVNGGPTSHNHP